MFNNYNPYYGQPQTPRFQPIENQTPQYMPQQTMNRLPSLQGKSVDSIEVVRATDIPMDGSISYFPLADGSAIVTKQLGIDGISKLKVYKPVEEKVKEMPTYATKEDLEELKNELRELKGKIEK